MPLNVVTYRFRHYSNGPEFYSYQDFFTARRKTRCTDLKRIFVRGMTAALKAAINDEDVHQDRYYVVDKIVYCKKRLDRKNKRLPISGEWIVTYPICSHPFETKHRVPMTIKSVKKYEYTFEIIYYDYDKDIDFSHLKYFVRTIWRHPTYPIPLI
jgi:hypothetical protein